MGKVAANADALGMSFGGSTIAPGVMVTEFDMVMHVVANSLNALPAALDAAEPRPSEVGKFFDIAVAASQQIHQCVVGQSSHIPLCRIRYDFIRQAAVGDDEVVANFQKSRRCDQPRADIAKSIAISCDGISFES